MGGKVLELETDRILENRKQGLEVTLCHTEIENIVNYPSPKGNGLVTA